MSLFFLYLSANTSCPRRPKARLRVVGIFVPSYQPLVISPCTLSFLLRPLLWSRQAPIKQIADPISLKFFAHPDFDAFKRDELDPWFSKVVVDKPISSRKGEREPLRSRVRVSVRRLTR